MFLVKEHTMSAPTNSLFTIIVYRWGNGWCFDDAVKGLVAEPFVLGASEIIDSVIERKYGEADHASEYSIVFSRDKFPGIDSELTRRQEDCGGYWYVEDDNGLEGWFCPATKLYFGDHPQSIFSTITKMSTSTYSQEWIQVA